MTMQSSWRSMVGSMRLLYFGLLEQSRVERQRQQLGQAHPPLDLGEIREDDVDVAAVFPQELAARSARRRRIVGVGDDGDAGEDVLAVGERLVQRDPLRAHRQAVGGVLDVA